MVTDQPLSQGAPAGGAVLVHNAETLAQIALLWSGHCGPLTRLVTLSGAVAAAGVIETVDSRP